MAKLSPMDLPYDKLQPIEKAVGYPVQRLGDAVDADVSVIELFARILAAYHEKPLETYTAWTSSQILDAVTLDDAKTDPTTPSEP